MNFDPRSHVAITHARRRRLSIPPLALVMFATLGAPPSAWGTALCPGTAGTAPQGTRSFLGRPCRDAGCTAHKAGFAWADRQGIDNAQACAQAEEPAFDEGCRSFAEDSVTAEQSGFQWARENRLVDACECRGAGPRFEAGCEAWVAVFAR